MIQKILAALLLIGALFGCYALFVEHEENQRHAYNPWVSRMAPLIKLHTTKQTGNDKPGEASYLSIIYLAWEASENGRSALDTAKLAATAAGAEPGEAARIGVAIHENVQFAKSMGVFSNAANALKMERGEPPVAHAKGWEDEPLVMTNLLSPVLAPELGYAIHNLRLVPESVRDMATDGATAATAELARKWLNEKILYPETYRAIAEKAKQR